MPNVGTRRAAVLAGTAALVIASVALGLLALLGDGGRLGAVGILGAGDGRPAGGAAPADAGAADRPVTVSKQLMAAEGHPKTGRDRLEAFRGLSTWIDTYDIELTPEEQVRIAAGMGVDAIYVQTERPSTEGLIHDPERLARTIELAHDHGLLVMVWTIPTFRDLDRDLARARAAIEFTTPRGDRADAFGLDIEIESMEWVPIRTRRLLQLSGEIREAAGPHYPMAAITLPPLQLELNTTWWPDFPYAELAEHFDVFVPMSYSSYRGTDAQTTYAWNRDNVVLTRRLAGVPDLPVHLAGGIADDLPEVTAFVRAAFDSGAIGAGLYDLHTTPPEAWPTLRALSRGG